MADSFWPTALGWAWRNWDQIRDRLGQVYDMFRRKPGDPPDRPGVLVIGPAGTGKTTLAKFLSSGYGNRLLEEPWAYTEDADQASFRLKDDPDVEVVVLPGQHTRQDAYWADVRGDVAAGKYRGVILCVSAGFHPLGMVSYRHHPLYTDSKDDFLDAYLAERRAEEERVLSFVTSAVAAAESKLWVLVVVTKQDLWWPEREAVRSGYTSGAWQAAADALRSALGVRNGRFEVTYASLVIANFADGEQGLLRANTAGYDQQRQVESLRRLFETIDGLRQWEGRP